MSKLFILNSLIAATSLTFAPQVYKAGTIFYYDNIARAKTNLNFDNINVSYDLRLLFGDKNNDKKISSEEYINFDFDEIAINSDDQYQDFKFLSFKPDNNNLYVYVVTKFEIGNESSLNIKYSDSIEMNSDNTAYIENIRFNTLNKVNDYRYKNQIFYKFRLTNYDSNYGANDVLRMYLYSFSFITKNSQKDYTIKEETELVYEKDTNWTSGTFYYFENNTYNYTGKLVQLIAPQEITNYFPTFAFFGQNQGRPDEIDLKSGKELTYYFVNFEGIEIDELVSVEYTFYKMEYDYLRYAPSFSNFQQMGRGFKSSDQKAFTDIYGGKYYSTSGDLETGGLNLNGQQISLMDYDETINVYSVEGSGSDSKLTEIPMRLFYGDYLATDDSGVKVNNGTAMGDYYNLNINRNAHYNGFSNAKLMNDGKPYVRSRSVNDNMNSYSYTTDETSVGTILEHYPLKRRYNFLPIVNLKTYNNDSRFNGDEYEMAKDFFDKNKENYSFAICIDGAQTDPDSTRSITNSNRYLEFLRSSNSSTGASSTEIYMTEVTTHCHEVYNMNLLKATARQNNGELITFNCVGDPAYTKYVTFGSISAPSIYDFVFNDVKIEINNFIDWLANLFNSNPVFKAIMIALGIIFGLFILILVFKLLKAFINLIKSLFRPSKKRTYKKKR